MGIWAIEFCVSYRLLEPGDVPTREQGDHDGRQGDENPLVRHNQDFFVPLIQQDE